MNQASTVDIQPGQKYRDLDPRFPSRVLTVLTVEADFVTVKSSSGPRPVKISRRRFCKISPRKGYEIIQ